MLQRHRVRHRRFSPQEDVRIRGAVEICGIKNWRQVIQMTGVNRTPKQVRERYQSYLDERVGTPWTLEEDQVLLTHAKDHLGQWSYIAKYIPGKSGDRVRTRYRQLNRQRVNGPPPVTAAEVQQVVSQLPDAEFEVQEVVEEYPSFPTQFDDGATWEDAWPWDVNPSPT
jgi:hypothetical protein